jgi:hypothetical protein
MEGRATMTLAGCFDDSGGTRDSKIDGGAESSTWIGPPVPV